MLKITQLLLLVTLMACGAQGKKSSLEFYPISEKDFSKFINKSSENGERRELGKSSDIHIVNNDYPIEISLYDDGSWYYNLENLGQGKGKWKYNKGRLELHAERVLFDMYIDIEAAQRSAKDLIIKFSDRHGPHILRMENRNIVK